MSKAQKVLKYQNAKNNVKKIENKVNVADIWKNKLGKMNLS